MPLCPLCVACLYWAVTGAFQGLAHTRSVLLICACAAPGVILGILACLGVLYFCTPSELRTSSSSSDSDSDSGKGRSGGRALDNEIILRVDCKHVA
jgi:hypothetical protein